MRFLKLGLVSVACLSLGIGVVACGDDDNGDNGAGGTGGAGAGGTGGTGGTGGAGGTGGTGGTAPEFIRLSGTVESHPLMDADLNFEEMELRLVDGQKAVTDPANAVLKTTDVEEDGSFDFGEVDISDAGIGIVLTAQGGNDIATSSIGVCQIGQGVHPTLTCRDRDDLNAFVVSRTLVDTLSTNLSKPDLETNGFVLGMVVDGGGNPLSDVDIDSGGEVTTLDNSLGSTGNRTTTEVGAFVVTGMPGVINIAPEQVGTSFVPPNQPVGIAPGVVFQVFFVGSDDAGDGDGD